MEDNQFQCAQCGGVFDKGWSDEEEAEESERLWGIKPGDEAGATVCDDCFNQFEVDNGREEILEAFKKACELFEEIQRRLAVKEVEEILGGKENVY